MTGPDERLVPGQPHVRPLPRDGAVVPPRVVAPGGSAPAAPVVPRVVAPAGVPLPVPPSLDLAAAAVAAAPPVRPEPVPAEAGPVAASAVGSAPLSEPELTAAAAGSSRPLVRAVAGAAVALAGVSLGIAALIAVKGSDPARSDPLAAERAAGRALDGAAATAPVPGSPGQGPAPQSTAVPSAPAAGASPPLPAALAPAAPDAAGPSAPSPARPAVTVLNNSRISDLAAAEAARYRSAGWPVALVGSLHGRIRASTVYYEAGQREQAQALAREFGLARVLPRLADLPGRGLTVVVTRDLR